MHSERKIKVILHGYLKKLYSDTIELTGFCPSDIINGMCKMTKAFNPKLGEERHLITVVGYDNHNELTLPFKNDSNELHLVPAMVGGKSGGFTKIAIGVVLIAASFIPGVNVLLWGSGAGAVMLGSILTSIGASLVLGGMLELLSPQPRADTFGNAASDPEASKYLAANQNTVKIGTRIPILYGTMKVYGHYLSFDVDSKDVAIPVT